MDFGIQLAETGKIGNFNKLEIWNEILDLVSTDYSIENILAHFKPSHNANATKFRLLTPKG